MSYMLRRWRSLAEDERREFEVWAGDGGPPPNLREVTEAEIVRDSQLCSYEPDARDFRQFVLTPGTPIVSMTLLLFYDKTGVGLVKDYYAQPEAKIRWFRFGCQHQYEEVSRPANHRSGIHVEVCKVCGYQHSYDTSD